MNRQLKVLIVGAGSIGERHLRCFQSTGRAEVMLCEIQDSLRDSVASRYHIKEAFADLVTALNAKPNAVVVCTPAHTHIPIALEAARRDCHLLIEKPLSSSLEGLEPLIELLQSKNLLASVAYVYRAHPVLQHMRKQLRSGRFGKPLQFTAQCGQNFPYYRPAYREIYYKDRTTGGGAVQDALTHVINAAEWLLSPVERVVADLDHLILEGVEVEDTVHVLARQGKMMSCFSLNQHQAPNEMTFTIACENGTLKFEYHHSRWSSQSSPDQGWITEFETQLERDTLFINQANSFLDSIENGTSALCSFDEGFHTLKVNLAILESAEHGSWMTISH